MTFKEALKAMRKGKKVRREIWEKDCYIKIGDECARPFDETTNAFYFRYKNEIIRVWKSDFYSYFKK